MLDYCRLCLREDQTSYKDITTSSIKCSDLNLIECLYWIFGVEVDLADEYSKLICRKCEYVVQYVGEFREVYKKNQLILSGQLSSFEYLCLSEISNWRKTRDIGTYADLSDADSFRRPEDIEKFYRPRPVNKTSNAAGTTTSAYDINNHTVDCRAKHARSGQYVKTPTIMDDTSPFISLTRLEDSDIFKEYDKITDELYVRKADFQMGATVANIATCSDTVDKDIATTSTRLFENCFHMSLTIPKLENTNFHKQYKKMNETTYKQIHSRYKMKRDQKRSELRKLRFLNYYYNIPTSALRELIHGQKIKQVNSSKLNRDSRNEGHYSEKAESLFKVGGIHNVEVCQYCSGTFNSKIALNLHCYAKHEKLAKDGMKSTTTRTNVRRRKRGSKRLTVPSKSHINKPNWNDVRQLLIDPDVKRKAFRRGAKFPNLKYIREAEEAKTSKKNTASEEINVEEESLVAVEDTSNVLNDDGPAKAIHGKRMKLTANPKFFVSNLDNLVTGDRECPMNNILENHLQIEQQTNGTHKVPGISNILAKIKNINSQIKKSSEPPEDDTVTKSNQEVANRGSNKSRDELVLKAMIRETDEHQAVNVCSSPAEENVEETSDDATAIRGKWIKLTGNFVISSNLDDISISKEVNSSGCDEISSAALAGDVLDLCHLNHPIGIEDTQVLLATDGKEYEVCKPPSNGNSNEDHKAAGWNQNETAAISTSGTHEPRMHALSEKMKNNRRQLLRPYPPVSPSEIDTVAKNIVTQSKSDDCQTVRSKDSLLHNKNMLMLKTKYDPELEVTKVNNPVTRELQMKTMLNRIKSLQERLLGQPSQTVDGNVPSNYAGLSRDEKKIAVISANSIDLLKENSRHLQRPCQYKKLAGTQLDNESSDEQATQLVKQKKKQIVKSVSNSSLQRQVKKIRRKKSVPVAMRRSERLERTCNLGRNRGQTDGKDGSFKTSNNEAESITLDSASKLVQISEQPAEANEPRNGAGLSITGNDKTCGEQGHQTDNIEGILLGIGAKKDHKPEPVTNNTSITRMAGVVTNKGHVMRQKSNTFVKMSPTNEPQMENSILLERNSNGDLKPQSAKVNDPKLSKDQDSIDNDTPSELKQGKFGENPLQKKRHQVHRPSQCENIDVNEHTKLIADKNFINESQQIPPASILVKPAVQLLNTMAKIKNIQILVQNSKQPLDLPETVLLESGANKNDQLEPVVGQIKNYRQSHPKLKQPVKVNAPMNNRTLAEDSDNIGNDNLENIDANENHKTEPVMKQRKYLTIDSQKVSPGSISGKPVLGIQNMMARQPGKSKQQLNLPTKGTIMEKVSLTKGTEQVVATEGHITRQEINNLIITSPKKKLQKVPESEPAIEQIEICQRPLQKLKQPTEGEVSMSHPKLAEDEGSISNDSCENIDAKRDHKMEPVMKKRKTTTNENKKVSPASISGKLVLGIQNMMARQPGKSKQQLNLPKKGTVTEKVSLSKGTEEVVATEGHITRQEINNLIITSPKKKLQKVPESEPAIEQIEICQRPLQKLKQPREGEVSMSHPKLAEDEGSISNGSCENIDANRDQKTEPVMKKRKSSTNENKKVSPGSILQNVTARIISVQMQSGKSRQQLNPPKEDTITTKVFIRGRSQELVTTEGCIIISPKKKPQKELENIPLESGSNKDYQPEPALEQFKICPASPQNLKQPTKVHVAVSDPNLADDEDSTSDGSFDANKHKMEPVMKKGEGLTNESQKVYPVSSSCKPALDLQKVMAKIKNIQMQAGRLMRRRTNSFVTMSPTKEPQHKPEIIPLESETNENHRLEPAIEQTKYVQPQIPMNNTGHSKNENSVLEAVAGETALQTLALEQREYQQVPPPAESDGPKGAFVGIEANKARKISSVLKQRTDTAEEYLKATAASMSVKTAVQIENMANESTIALKSKGDTAVTRNLFITRRHQEVGLLQVKEPRKEPETILIDSDPDENYQIESVLPCNARGLSTDKTLKNKVCSAEDIIVELVEENSQINNAGVSPPQNPSLGGGKQVQATSKNRKLNRHQAIKNLKKADASDSSINKFPSSIRNQNIKLQIKKLKQPLLLKNASSEKPNTGRRNRIVLTNSEVNLSARQLCKPKRVGYKVLKIQKDGNLIDNLTKKCQRILDMQNASVRGSIENNGLTENIDDFVEDNGPVTLRANNVTVNGNSSDCEIDVVEHTRHVKLCADAIVMAAKSTDSVSKSDFIMSKIVQEGTERNTSN